MGVGKIIAAAIRDRVPRAAGVFEGRPVEIFVNSAGGGSEPAPEKATLAALWKFQPHLRTVIDFYARNIAQLALQAFVRAPDGSSERDRTSYAARRLCVQPNGHMTSYELFYDLVSNLQLYNRAYWFFLTNAAGETEIHPFPASWVTPVYDGYAAVSHYEILAPKEPEPVKVKPEDCLAFEGWNPAPGAESSLVETLRLVLEENHHSRKYRVQFWRKSGRVGTYLTRPVTAPAWDDTARKRFYTMFEEFVGDKGRRAGSTPLLEDGIELKRAAFTSADEQWAESVKLSLRTVAQVYQINPAMLGDIDGTTYANMREFNRSLYSNTLGPLVRFIEARINVFALPRLEAAEGTFVEFNVQEKLRGSFEEQASLLSTAIGAPWLTRNEGRQKFQNLPPIEGGDELITPLNVLVGGQTSPQDGGAPPGAGKTAAHAIIRKHLERISRVIPSKGMTRPRFEKELAEDLTGHTDDPAALAQRVHDLIEANPNAPVTGVISSLEGESRDSAV